MTNSDVTTIFLLCLCDLLHLLVFRHHNSDALGKYRKSLLVRITVMSQRHIYVCCLRVGGYDCDLDTEIKQTVTFVVDHLL